MRKTGISKKIINRIGKNDYQYCKSNKISAHVILADDRFLLLKVRPHIHSEVLK